MSKVETCTITSVDTEMETFKVDLTIIMHRFLDMSIPDGHGAELPKHFDSFGIDSIQVVINKKIDVLSLSFG